MQEVMEAIHRHLGRRLEFEQLDYYQVVGLELFCDDEQRLRKALQDATNVWMQSETGRYPESAQIVGKLLKQAQLILLDPKKRAIYNTQLAKLRKSHSKSEPRPTPSEAQGASNAPSFPAGDPMAPFSVSAGDWTPDTSSPSAVMLASITDVATRRSELIQLFPSMAELDPENEEVAPAQQPNLDTFATPTEARAPATRPAGTSISRVEQIRKRRNRNRALIGGSMVAAATGLLLFSAIAFVNNRNRLARQERPTKDLRTIGNRTPPTAEATPLAPAIDQERSPEPRVVSNLPSVRRELEASQMPTEPSRSPEPPMASEPPMDAEPSATPEPPPAPEPTDSPEWAQHMKLARAALEARKFEAFEKEVDLALRAAQTQSAKDKSARLDQLGQLYKISLDAFEEAKRKAKGASSLKVGTATISIVESTQEKLIVRSQGKNQSYEWDKLPFGIAVALCDLGLNDQAPVDLAARAVFFSLVPTYRDAAASNELIRKRIREWFEKSLGKGQVRADLDQALTDAYE